MEPRRNGKLSSIPMDTHEVLEVASCARCCGVGELDNCNKLPKSRHERVCDYCLGKKLVVLKVCRGCGRPAGIIKGPMSYCGRKECWEKLVEEVVEDEKPIVRAGFSPFSIVDKRRFIALGPSMMDRRQNVVDRAHRLGVTSEQFLRMSWKRE